MNKEDIEFYSDYYEQLIKAKKLVERELLCEFQERMEHFKIRIKSKESTIAKLEKMNLEPTSQSAIMNLTDIVGMRIICRFVTDVYDIAYAIEHSSAWECVKIKDYISFPKENGYRSYHIILEVMIDEAVIPVEIQIRTIAQDMWASLEHKMKYKKKIEHVTLIQSELKRLAEEMASSDICMQTLHELIHEAEEE